VKKKRLLFIIDAWETLDHAADTTLRLIEEALLLGAECFIAENRSIGLEKGVARAEIAKVTSISRPRSSDNVRRAEPRWAPLKDFAHIFYRTDPPVDLSYLLPLQILASVERATGVKPKIHSSTESRFLLNEKWGPAPQGEVFYRSGVWG
jgi:glutathione synthase/RimK-type ligase-like ATP-grasp enzyme